MPDYAIRKKAWKLVEKSINLPGFEPEMVYLFSLFSLFLAVLLAVGSALYFTFFTTFPSCILSMRVYVTVERETFLLKVRETKSSNLDPGISYPEFLLWLSSLPSGK
jgi:hypothetical protein